MIGNRMINRAACSLGLAAILACLAATPALAAPQLGVELSRDQESVSRSDEGVGYTVEVENLASGGSAQVGDVLTCVGTEPSKGWLPRSGGTPPEEFVAPTFSFEWRRNGAPIPAASAETYVVAVADEGKTIQCVVTGTNPRGAAKVASLPAVVVDPQPATEPPKSSDPYVGNFFTSPSSRPRVTNEAGTSNPQGLEKRLCREPTNLEVEGVPFTGPWTYQWLRNGKPIETAEAETSEYQPVAADEGTVVQCEMVGTGAGGAVLGISEGLPVAPSIDWRFFPRLQASEIPAVETPASTSGVVTVELELPGGSETFPAKTEGSGWSCEKLFASGAEHARAICTRSDQLPPQSSYPPLKVISALGADAPDIAVAKATASGGGAEAPASATDEFTFTPPIPFGLEAFEAAVLDKEGNPYTQAGGHPYSGVAHFEFAKKRRLIPIGPDKYTPVENTKQVITDVPRGFVGNALSVPELCPGVDDLANEVKTCPAASVVGGIDITLPGVTATNLPIYAIEPEFGTPAQFAFSEGVHNVYTLSTHLRPADGYAVSFELAPAPSIELLNSTVTLCDFGANTTGTEINPLFTGCKKAGEPGSNPVPLFTNPTRCQGPPPVTRAFVDSWEHPDHFAEASFTNAAITGCEEVSFEPEIELQPTSKQADSPTGLDVEVKMPSEGLETQEGISQANLKQIKVAFPQGMAVNASAGHGLGSCSADQVKLKTNLPIECPDSSKVGTIEIDTPLIKDTLKGDLYIAKQGAVDGALIGLYLVFDSKKNGILIKLPGKVVPDPKTDQLIVTFDESPEAPFSAVRMHFAQGPRATLINPPKCGKYEIKAEMVPWTIKDLGNPTKEETATSTSSFKVSQGPNGGPCPSGGLDPKLSAGTENPTAGKTSPFSFRLSREDGSDRFSALSLNTPRGLTAYLKGIPYCPDAVINSIPSAELTGQNEIDHPSCPAASQVGTASAGAGAGPNPLFVDTGRVYLAGPYKGAPLSLVVVAPAVAGPLDLGSVVVRNALYLDPETAQVTVKSDPVPTILHGILLDLRDIRVAIDRPNFTLNPTNCDPLSVAADVKGESGASASVSNRFQVGGCDALPFAPKLSTELSGGTKRGAHPILHGVLTAKPGEANIASAQVTIPRSEFLDQAHIRTICTRVQFAAKACPAGSIYGHATATTPLLDYPVSGPVYLRSSDHKLPDLVVALRGPDYQPIEAVVVGRIDSIKGQIRTSFESAPDVPLTRFDLTMQGGKKGLLVNSRDICAGAYRATVALTGQNGKTSDSQPLMRNGKCAKGRKGHHRHRRH